MTRRKEDFWKLLQVFPVVLERSSLYLASAPALKARNETIFALLSRHVNNKANGFWSAAKMTAYMHKQQLQRALGSSSRDAWVRAKETSGALPLQSGPESCQKFLAATCEVQVLM